MRKSTPLLLMLMLLFSLPAQEKVRSNSIGQDRGRFGEESEYSLIIQEDESTLYHQDEAVWKESRTISDDVVEISTYTYASDTLHFKQYENNRLIAEGEGEAIRYFYYDERGLMVKSMLLLSGKLAEMELYTYDVGTKSLNSIQTITGQGRTVSYFGNPIGQKWFSYTEDDLFTKVTELSQNLQIRELWKGNTRIKGVKVEIPPEGGIRLITETQGKEESELYDDKGLLILRVSPSLTTEYRYNEGRTLVEARENGPGLQKRITRYEEGRNVSESLYQDGVLEKETLYPQESGKVETLYDEGTPYCDITYALDGKRVLSIRYR